MKGIAATKGIYGLSVLLLAMIAAAREQPPYSLAAIQGEAGSNFSGRGGPSNSSLFAIEASNPRSLEVSIANCRNIPIAFSAAVLLAEESDTDEAVRIAVSR